MPGGCSARRNIDDEVKAIAHSFKDDAQRLAQAKGLNAVFAMFEPLHFKRQVVAGTNLFVSVKTDDAGNAIHLRIFRPLPHTGKAPELVGVSVGHNINDEVEYFSPS